MTKFVTYLFGVVALIISCNAIASSPRISHILNLILNESADRLSFVAFNPGHQYYPSVMLFDDDGYHVWDLTQGLEPFPTRIVPRNLKFVDNKLFFTVANDGLTADLYRTHLAATEYEFTRLTSNFDLTNYVDNKHEFTSANGKLYFIADNMREAGFVNQLWVTDGSTNGVTGLTVSSAFSLISYKGELYFFIDDTDYSVVNPPSKTSLWKTDGTSENTVRISDLDDIGFYLSTGEDYLYSAGELLYFPCRSNEHGTELCRTDGTAAGTVFVKNIDPTSSDEGSGSVVANSSNPAKFSSVNGKLIFIAENAGDSKALWVSDGSDDGTLKIKQFSGANNDPLLYDIVGNTPDGRLIFTAPAIHSDQEVLWVTDATQAGTNIIDENKYIVDDNIAAYEITTPSVQFGDYLYFSAISRTNKLFCNHLDCNMSRDLFRSNGDSVELVKDMTTGVKNQNMVVVNSKIYFVGHDMSSGVEIWESDGTEQGTKLAFDLLPGAPSSQPSQLIVIPQ